MLNFNKVGVIADNTSNAKAGLNQLLHLNPDIIDLNRSNASVDIVIVLGGDGFMLQIMHRYIDRGTPLYGMNCGTVGFLLNSYNAENIRDKLCNARSFTLHPLSMFARTVTGKEIEALAFNEVSLFRESRQAAKIRVTIDHVVRIKELVGDGILVATPAGSTAYNSSAGGTILPLSANVFALTPIAPFRPRLWRGALLERNASIMFDIINPQKRPVSAVADFTEVRNVKNVFISEQRKVSLNLLFDPEHNLEERIRMEQFLD
jgi:NAD+ kinase